MAVSLNNQVVLVVGARVMASARRQDRLRSLQNELSGEGHAIEIEGADASSAGEMMRLAVTNERHHLGG